MNLLLYANEEDKKDMRAPKRYDLHLGLNLFHCFLNMHIL